MSITQTLSGQGEEGYAKVNKPRVFVFPEDHGVHPEYRNEWWYFTGNLQTPNNREFGFQVTLFRYAIAPVLPASDSAWVTNQVYLAHIALSDIENGKYYSDERFSRGALELAGVNPDPFRAWLDNWSITGNRLDCEDCFSVDVSASAKNFKLNLHLNSMRGMVMHGESGYSRKSPAAGNASYYYSCTRLHTTGRVSLNNEDFDVHGTSWFDHEWSTSSLMADQAGWDWFSIQLSNQSDLMVFRLRHSSDPDKHYYYGSLVYPDGKLEVLNNEDFKIHPVDTWKSTATGVIYPTTWKLVVPGKHINLLVKPKILNQEMNHSFRYWEGAITAAGTVSNLPASGNGYMELTGY